MNSVLTFLLYKKAVRAENVLDLVGASIGHRPVVLGFDHWEGGLRWVCGSIWVGHCQTEKGSGHWLLSGYLEYVWIANLIEPEGQTMPSTGTWTCSSQAPGWWEWGLWCQQRPSPPSGDLWPLPSATWPPCHHQCSLERGERAKEDGCERWRNTGLMKVRRRMRHSRLPSMTVEVMGKEISWNFGETTATGGLFTRGSINQKRRKTLMDEVNMDR